MVRNVVFLDLDQLHQLIKLIIRLLEAPIKCNVSVVGRSVLRFFDPNTPCL